MLPSTRASALRKLPLAITLGLASLATQQAFAHGYVESPKSRAFMCNSAGGNLNGNCGPVTYEPQSVEYSPSVAHHYPKDYCAGDFTQCGPANGTIPAGGIASFSQLNEQTATRWQKTTIKPGMNEFTWHYKAGHASAYYQFYITKKDWNPNQPLTRDSFELTPLLNENAGGARPQSGSTTKHKVNIPADRSGYHVILATWKIADTAATFYQVIDVNIDNDGAPVPDWKILGAVQPEELRVGDKVKTRVFTNAGEQQNRQTVLNIETAEQAKANTWPFLLAQKVNKANAGYLMGELNANNEVVPHYGKNTMYAKKGSDVVNVEIQKDQPSIPGELKISGLQAEYTLKDGATDLHFNAIAQGGKYTVSSTVFNGKNESIAHVQAEPGNNMPHFSIPLRNVSEGEYDVVVVAKPEKGEQLQQSQRITLKAEETGGGTSEYDFVFPKGLSSYKAGTKVLGKDGKVYECKPFPYSGYCIQWNAGATHYEPGTGSNWQDAWIRK
ncbi:N-acetylglucosamine-binding protein GbpA [Pseudomonas sp. MRSN 12121]|uniref:N-acetylglucosamine-binding protein GbpA n=1 Tax=Pseudomonas sp. MRSN 12121 TaxID=1611770 RepID=UPI0005BEC811|nr:N-acetylglucosamine-binding protein GbpA [Pseudomonas sp. MRSN 12121]AJO80592.1 multidrug transporter [Pseudomonas sp. MRSN 12121]